IIIGTTKINIPDMAKALAIGQSLFTKNSSQIILPKYNLSLPPNSSGITNSPTTGINTNILPAIIPGRDKGIITLIKVLKGFAPKSLEASIKFKSNFTKYPYNGKIMNGKYV